MSSNALNSKRMFERGQSADCEQLLPFLYGELKSIAQRLLFDERINHTLTATALVHEAYIRLANSPSTDDNYPSNPQFMHAAAQCMRRILVDSARRKNAQKRGGGQMVLSFNENCDARPQESPDIQALDEVLTALEQMYPDLAQLVELRYFAGLTMAQAAEVLGISKRTAERDWHFARAWLRSQLA